MASTLVALQTATVGAGGSASVTFSSIPQTYNDLVIKASARVNNGNVEMYMTYNGNSSAVYSYIYLRSNAAVSVASGSASGQTYDVNYTNWSTTTANTFGNAEIYIPNYATSNNKSFSFDTVTENNSSDAWNQFHAGLFSKTDAITSVTFTANTGSFVQYSTFTLYGVYNSPLDTAVEAPTIGTATAGSQAANVAFTPAGSGAPASSYVVTSSPGGLTATGGSSPIQIGGLTSGTAYTFTVRGQNPGGLGSASAASNSVTPYDGYESIATVNVGSGGLSSISFTSIPQTYTHLQLRFALLDGGGNGINFRVNSDTGANYSQHAVGANGSITTAQGSGGTNSYSVSGYVVGTIATYPNVGIIDILDYANTNKYKTSRSLFGADKNATGGSVEYSSGVWLNTNAITSINLFTGATINQYSSFALYGIK